MKKLKQTIAEIQSTDFKSPEHLMSLLWQYICYSPKMPVRLQQQQLLDRSELSVLKVYDQYFEKKELTFNVFKWGNGQFKILLTHGWGSKASDFNDIILGLEQLEDVQIIAFDAPGNGSSEGSLSNLLLYIQAVKAVITWNGEPNCFIGHSLGAMANVISINEMNIHSVTLISLTPLLQLQENFEYSMNMIGIPNLSQVEFLNSFRDKFGVAASNFTINKWYDFEDKVNHWVAYDSNDKVAPYLYLENFFEKYPSVKKSNYIDVGHDKIIKSPAVIDDLVAQVASALQCQN